MNVLVQRDRAAVLEAATQDEEIALSAPAVIRRGGIGGPVGLELLAASEGDDADARALIRGGKRSLEETPDSLEAPQRDARAVLARARLELHHYQRKRPESIGHSIGQVTHFKETRTRPSSQSASTAVVPSQDKRARPCPRRAA